MLLIASCFGSRIEKLVFTDSSRIPQMMIKPPHNQSLAIVAIASPKLTFMHRLRNSIRSIPHTQFALSNIQPISLSEQFRNMSSIYTIATQPLLNFGAWSSNNYSNCASRITQLTIHYGFQVNNCFANCNYL